MSTRPSVTSIAFRSSAFAIGDSIPVQYTCDGLNISPPLQWDREPDGTESIAIVARDPDAPSGTFIHWVIYNIPPESKSLSEGVPNLDTLPSGALQGKNSAGKIGYTGPCPPSGTHRYMFHIYALDEELELQAGVTEKQLMQEMEGHVKGEGELYGIYRSKRR